MKRLVCLLLTAVILLSAGAALADTWYCPECGQQNDGNFCPNDGTKRPEGGSSLGSLTGSSSSLRVDDVRLETDGSVTVSWSGGTAPYSVHYQSYIYDNHNAGADVISWIATPSSISSTRYNFTRDFTPGERYWVYVTDKDNNIAWYDFNPTVRAFSRGNMPCVVSLRTRRNNRSSTVGSLSAREIESELGRSMFGATIKITTRNLNADVTAVIRFSVTLPNGESILFFTTSPEIFKKQYGYVYWESFDFIDLWNMIIAGKGSIPVGTYTLKVLLDNEYLLTENFQIGN